MGQAYAAPKSTPPSAEGGNKHHSDFEVSMYQRNLFLVLALNMTWQLAIVVVVPIVGGYYLDQHFHTVPALTIVGAVVALLGVIGVLKRIVTVAAQRSGVHPSTQNGDKK